MTCAKCNEQVPAARIEAHLASCGTAPAHDPSCNPCEGCAGERAQLEHSLNACANRAQRLVAIVEESIAGTLSREGQEARLREAVE